MSGRRIERLNEQLKREIVEILRREVRDPRVGPVSITQVSVAPDLSTARLWVHALDTGEGSREELLEGLRAAAPYVRGELGRRLHIRRAPELNWVWDETFEHAQRIEQLLAEVRPADQAADDPTGDDAD